MAAIPFPTSSFPGPKPQETQGRLVNVMAEKDPAGVLLRRVPGLDWEVDTGGAGCRALHAFSSGSVIAVMEDRVYLLGESAGVMTSTDVGELTGTDLITIAQNNASPTNAMVAVTEDGVFDIFTSSPPTSFVDGDLPASNSVTVLNGYFLWTTNDGKVYASDLNALTVNALSFAVTPGPLVRGVAFGDHFLAMGTKAISFYRDAGLTPFPLQLVTTIDKGLIAKHAVAGWQPGWASALIFVATDNVVYRLNGYTPQRVSNHAVERQIEALEDKTTLQASVYSIAGHPCWVLTCSEWTWALDLSTNEWHERKSYNIDRWRASCSVFAFGKWLVGDYESGVIYSLSDDAYSEHTDPLVAQIDSLGVENFPAPQGVPRADFRFTAATGMARGDDPVATDPRVSISWSDDGGYSWSSPIMREFGKQGQGEKRVSLFRTGQAKTQGRKWRVTCSDPVHFALKQGEMVAEGRLA